jgi:hypothetical protein
LRLRDVARAKESGELGLGEPKHWPDRLAGDVKALGNRVVASLRMQAEGDCISLWEALKSLIALHMATLCMDRVDVLSSGLLRSR